MPPETSVTSDPATAVSQRENSTVATETPEQKTDDMDSTATPEESRDAGNAVIEDRTTATLQADEDSPITKVEEKPEENDTAAAADTVQTSSQTPKDNPSNPKNPPNAEPIVPVEDTIEVSTIASRPKRRSTKLINYKEKQESDIPSLRMDSKRTTKLRRTKSSTSESTSPPPGANSSLPSSSASKTVSYFDVDDVVPLNYQPPVSPDSNFNELIDIRNAKIDSTETVLTLKNGYTIKKGDCIYMICEPATEPFYIAQILGFTKKDKNSTYKKASNYMFSVCWFYRPRDLNRRLTDSRLVYASLHRDNCPLTSFRGFVTVKHKSEIEDLDTYKQQPDCFYFDKLYDRYMIKMYDMIPTVKLLHLPPNYYKALNKRFEYIFVEVGKADELLSSPKNCEKCLQWCSNSDSILCSGCQKSYHLLCLDPPILSKPKRGFAWYCAACNKELEDKLAENRGKMLESSLPSQIIKAEELASQDTDISDSTDQNPCSNGVMSNTDDNNSTDIPSSLRYEQLAEKFLEDDKNVSFKKRRALEEWPYRYLGVHAKFEDALDLQDRPYARAASRLGSKYQCTSVCDWFDHTVQYYDANESSSNSNNRKLKKYYNRSKKSQTPLLVEEDELENKKFPVPEPYKDKKPKDFPGWLQPRPKGYIERGGDDTSTLLWKMPVSATSTEKELGDMVEQYIKDCSGVAKRLKLTTVTTPNFVDAILLILMRHNYKADDCMEDVNKLTRESLKEPTFTEEEVKRFEDSVRIHGSELYPVFKDVKTQTSAMVVRFYYLWKKTKNGHEIWDNFSGRAKNRLKTTKNVGVDLDNPEDDGAYSSGKINRSQVKFRCMYCDTNHSAEWYRAPGAVNDAKNFSCEGLCYRCAKLWRKYAAKWENPMDLIKNQEKKGSSSSRKKIEYALFEEAELVLKAREQYKLHPRKVSEGLTEYKTIDTDTDYINFGKEKPKEKNKKRSTKKQTKNPAPSTSNTSPSTSSARNSTSDVMSENKVKLKKEKKQAATSGSVARKAKRTAKDVEMEVSSEVKKENKDLDSDKPKKRKYKKRKPVDRNLKFVYGKVVDDSSNGSKKLTTKRKECEEANSTESGDLNRYEGLREELMEAKAQLEENNQSGLFNAFLDMKLRERIELLEKECSSLIPEDHVADSSESNLTFVSTSPSSTRPGTKDSTDHSDSSSKKYVRRRLYLSKTSVPGSGVFETPPIQLPSDSPATATSNNGSTLRNKFVFQMYDQISNMGELNYNISNSEFQSQPLLLPSGISQIESLANVDQSKLGTDSNGTPKESSSSIHASVPSSANTPIMAISSRPNTSREAATIRTGKNNGSQGFFNVSFKGKEYLNLSPSFKVKMLSPLIDYNDKITKDMISRYTSKFDVFNPLLSDDFYISPIYQMRPSSKELHTLWKQYQTSRKSKGRANKAFQPLFPADKRPCCVCRELGDTNQMLICSNCGLNVHASCYGVKLSLKMEKKPGEYNWHCDPCSNDLHPLVSTQYLCMLCNSRESNMDQAIKGDPVSIPDALKRTAEGRWCHVTCSLFSDNIKYGTDSLQPISGTHVTGITNVFQTCDVCLNNGGSIASCEFCPKKAHVTCGLDYGWKLGFKMLQICETTDGDVIEIKDKKLLGKLKPIIYCYDHTVIPELSEQSRILHVSEFGRKLNSKEKGYKTLLELYFSDERKKTENLTSGELRRKVYDDMRGAFDELAKKAHVHSGSSMVQEQNWNHKCSKCSRTSSLLWHNVTSENDVVCHVCFMDQESKVAVPDLSSVNTQKFDYSLYGC